MSGRPLTVALTGNPNAGKSSLFNAITGANQRVGNFPGVTIEKLEGDAEYRGRRITVVDLPGTYSLTPFSPEEIVTRRFIIDEKPDVVVNVVEGCNLERNLLLTVQLMEMGVDLLVALNMIDEVEEKGILIDQKQLQKLLGSHIVPTSARQRRGIDSLLDHILRVADGRIEIGRNKVAFSPEIEAAVTKIAGMLARERGLEGANHRWLAIKLLENDPEAYQLVRQHPVWVKVELALQEAIVECGRMHRTDPESLITEDRHAFIRGAMQECVRVPNAEKASITDYIDMVVLNRVLGIPIFLAVVWAIFQLTFTLGQPLAAALEYLFALAGAALEPHLSDPLLRSVLIDGVVAGVGGVVVFLPNIVLLFIGLSFLEASGYMARAAFVIDKVMHRFGLHGKSFIPMVTGFGCSIPAIMATRTLKSRSDRLATIMAIPFMSCGAKLPVYVLLAGAFFPPAAAANVMFAIYLLGIAVGLWTAWMLKKSVLKSESEPFVMELPPYRWPTMASVIFQAKMKALLYLKKAGTLILGAVILVWAASNFPKSAEIDARLAVEAARIQATASSSEAKRSALLKAEASAQSAQLEYSAAGRVGKIIEPVIRPLGFDWRIGIALVTGLAAKEVVVSTLGTIVSIGHAGQAADLTSIVRSDPGFSPATALSLMVFVLLYIPCVASLGVMKKEVGSWRPVIAFTAYVLVIAWTASFVTYRLALLML
jgi:ferrous iron transport protein B